MFEFSRDETEWRTQHGERKKVKDLEDDHVRNILTFLPTSHYASNPQKLAALTALFQEELRLRGLSALAEPEPYVDPEGHLRIWSPKEGTNIILQNARKFETEWFSFEGGRIYSIKHNLDGIAETRSYLQFKNDKSVPLTVNRTTRMTAKHYPLYQLGYNVKGRLATTGSELHWEAHKLREHYNKTFKIVLVDSHAAYIKEKRHLKEIEEQRKSDLLGIELAEMV